MAQILVTKPGALNQRDRAALRRAGVVCVEADDPSSVKLIQPGGAELGGSDLLLAAMRAISKDRYSSNVAEVFPRLMTQMLEEARAELGGRK